MPSSSFGQTLTAQGTGGSSSQPRSPAPPQPSAMDDLLGDNDQEQSKKLTDESAELGNMSNQINTLRTQMQETHNRKASTEAELNNTSAQKRDLEVRLSQFRAQYEAEVQIVKQLEEKLNASRQETRKLQQEFAMIEGTYQDLSSQHQQIASALEADQRENASLKERIRQMNAEIAQLRPQLDKMRSDARQQKGMVAINKKQLATNEGERDKLKNEMSELTKAAQDSYNRSPEATPGPPTAGSPAPSNASHSTNPFFRRSPQPAENTMSPSGFSREASQANFDNFFGPSISAQPGAPQTSFKGESGAPGFSVPSGQSVQSSEPGVPTPSTSPPLSQYHESPRVGEGPAPSVFPIREGTGRQESFSSSVKAGPQASRFGHTGNETPTNAPGSPSAVAAEPAKDTSAPEFGPSPFNRNLTSSPAASHASDAARSIGGPERKDTYQSFGPPSTSVDMPGSFPDVSTPLQPEATGQSAMSDRSKGSFSFPRSDPFGSQPQRQGSAAKADFDAAFAGFGSGKQFQERQNTGSSFNGSVGSASKFNQEFPPIETFGGDEDSDTNSEHGFDDNFAPASPQSKREDAAPAPATSGPEGTGDTGALTLSRRSSADCCLLVRIPRPSPDHNPPRRLSAPPRSLPAKPSSEAPALLEKLRPQAPFLLDRHRMLTHHRQQCPRMLTTPRNPILPRTRLRRPRTRPPPSSLSVTISMPDSMTLPKPRMPPMRTTMTTCFPRTTVMVWMSSTRFSTARLLAKATQWPVRRPQLTMLSSLTLKTHSRISSISPRASPLPNLPARAPPPPAMTGTRSSPVYLTVNPHLQPVAIRPHRLPRAVKCWAPRRRRRSRWLVKRPRSLNLPGH
ncbi:hypothetical protein B0J12DRAFT_378359 [Macrophomina phaseolina]|uniref:Uncharacterized protein n=1 Tax=Macrophomina phaseolina TaxID=35725 RepID=A0ABQ8GKJ1_9PEZI|nr:hypothetical protein B0J12DRAFT_378359 [Macrophomina phaseolina]